MDKVNQITIPTALKAIRLNCLECMGGSAKEVATCPSLKCNLFPFRFGTNPRIAPVSEEKKEKLVVALQKARAKKALKGSGL